MSEQTYDARNMEPLNEDSISSVKYYYNPVTEKYYKVREGNGGYSVGTGFQEVNPNSRLGKRLAREYPRGNTDVGQDYNPFLETVSTIKTKFGGAGTAVNGAGGSVRFPHDMLISEGEDFVMFDFYNYKPPFQDRVAPDGKYINQTLKQYSGSAYSAEFFKDKAYPQILLYMPQDVTDTFAAKWEGKKFGAMTTGMIAAAGQTGNMNKINQGARTVKKAIGKGSVEAAASIVSGLAQKITGDTITAGDLFAGISGVARNPNVEVLFQSMELRTFDLTFKMTPYDENDVQRIDAIIKIFKQAMLPQYSLGKDVKVFGQKNDALQAGFIQVPKVCAVNFMRGNIRNRFLPRYKMCAITDVNVNYTPDGVYATFNRSSPVATELKISFMETKLVFSEDIAERGF